MAIVIDNFLTAGLNQFAVSAVRGTLADWGLNAQVMEVTVADDAETTIRPGDPVKLVSSPVGIPTVDLADEDDKIYGFMIWSTKSIKGSAGKRITILRDGGVMKMVTADALTAGDEVYWKPSDGSVTKTPTDGAAFGIAVEDCSANENGTLVRIEVVKAGLGSVSSLSTRLAAVEGVIPSGASSSNKLLDKTTADATYEPKAA